MATETTTRLVDDLDLSDATQTVMFTFDGVAYEIDLNDSHIAQFTQAVKRYVDSARRVTTAGPHSVGRSAGRGISTAKSDSKAGGSIDTHAVRAWAAENGYVVADRGRIPTAVVEAYLTAQAGSAPSPSTTPTKKTTAKKAAAPAKKTVGKKAAVKKAAPAKKSAAKKTAPSKTVAKKAAPAKKSVPAKKSASKAAPAPVESATESPVASPSASAGSASSSEA